MFTGGSMDEIEVRDGAFGREWSCNGMFAVVYRFEDNPSDPFVDFTIVMAGLKTPAEARALAQRIIAVADAVEAELKGKS